MAAAATPNAQKNTKLTSSKPPSAPPPCSPGHSPSRTFLSSAQGDCAWEQIAGATNHLDRAVCIFEFKKRRKETEVGTRLRREVVTHLVEYCGEDTDFRTRFQVS